MKNLKKLLAVVVAVTVLLTAMVPAFAAVEPTYTAEADILNSLGLYSGTSSASFVPALDKDLKREDGVLLLVVAVGKIAEARAMTAEDVAAELAKFSDTAALPGYAKSAVAYAIKNNLIAGVGGGKFGVGQKMSGKMVATILLAQLGYVTPTDFTYNTAVDKVAELAGSELEADIANSTLRDATVAVLFTALSAKAKGSETTLIADLVAAKAVTEEAAVASGLYVKPAPVALAVDSIAATNLKEITVKFNKAVAVEVKDSYFTVKNTTKNTTATVKATLNADKTAVVLAETSTNNAIGANQDVVEVTVSKDLVGADTTKTLTLFDVTVPEVTGIKLTGPQTFEISFSEPVDADFAGTVEVNNGIYGVSSAPAVGTNVVKVTLSASKLTDGKYTVKVKDFKDFAGYSILAKELELAYAKDTTALTATLTKATQTSVEITFNKEVKGFTSASTLKKYFYHTFSAYMPSSASISADEKVVTLDFINYPLPEGTVKVVLVYNADDKKLKDAWDNEMTGNLEFTAAVTADKTKPEVKEIKVTAQNKIEIIFTEDVAAADKAASYTVKDKDAKVVAITDSNVAYNATDKKATITFPSNLGGDYTIEVKDIKDTALEANTISTITKAFTVNDVTAPLFTSVSAIGVDGTTEDYIYVTFPEKMATTGQFSVLEKANYVVSGSALGDNDKVELFGDASKVKITIADETLCAFGADNNPNPNTLQIARVADAAGNKTALLSGDLGVTADSAPVITAIKTINKNTIEITFNKVLNTFSADGIMVAKAATPLSIYGNLAALSKKEDKDGNTTLTATLKEAVNLAGSDDINTIHVATVASKLKSETGKFAAEKVATSTSTVTMGAIAYAGYASAVTIVDGFAPSVSAASTTAAALATGATITLDFDEDVNAANVAFDLEVTYDGKVLIPVTEYTVTDADADTLTIQLLVKTEVDKKVVVKTKATINYLGDTAGNKVNAFTKEVTIK